jgi:hypothetical protein
METGTTAMAFNREDDRGLPRLHIECASDDPRVAGWRDVCVQCRRPFAIISRKPGGYASCHVDIEPIRYQWRCETVRFHPVLLEEACSILACLIDESDHPLVDFGWSNTMVRADYLPEELAEEFTVWLATNAFCEGKDRGIIRDIVPMTTVIDLDSYRQTKRHLPEHSLRGRVRGHDGKPVDWGDAS